KLLVLQLELDLVHSELVQHLPRLHEREPVQVLGDCVAFSPSDLFGPAAEGGLRTDEQWSRRIRLGVDRLAQAGLFVAHCFAPSMSRRSVVATAYASPEAFTNSVAVSDTSMICPSLATRWTRCGSMSVALLCFRSRASP